MRLLAVLLLLAVFPAAAWSADDVSHSVSNNDFPADYREVTTSPRVGEGIQKYAEDGQQGPQENFGVQPIHDNQIFATFRADRFEYQWHDQGQETLLWDVMSWAGADYNKIYLESEGAWLADESKIEEAEVDLFYSRTVAPFWEFRLGARHDFAPHPSRSFAAVGLLGLAPYWFELDANAYVSEDGDFSAKIEAEYELLLTQRLVLVPRLETGLSLQDVPEYEQWRGITDLTLGVRLMYHFHREFAPYLGVNWHRKIGKTAHNLDNEGQDIDSAALLAGLRFWF